MIRIALPVRAGIIGLACVAPFVFPTFVTTVLAFAAALIFPPVAIVLGMLVDMLYEPAGYWPLASMFGVLICVIALFVRSFVKARIM